MPILTPEMKRLLDEQRLGFVATVCPDGTPNLSPKGTTIVWDDDHLVFCRYSFAWHKHQPALQSPR
ncbi:MAG: pyridoxamine 5'-phosphate oxidase family protein [Kouleothrix sp.]|nr:pyridoxamine 5'-phosphate oxidase family protein [Kouleothrix sp.]